MSENVQNEIHMHFRDIAAVSLLFAPLEKSFPHFHGKEIHTAVDDGGKAEKEKVFHALKEFSTSFPHPPVDAEM